MISRDEKKGTIENVAEISLVVPFRIKHRPSVRQVHRLASLARDIGVLRQSSFVDALGRFDDFVQTRGNLRWGDTSTKDVARRHRRPVEVAVGILAFYKDGALQREARKQSCVRGQSRTWPSLA